MTNSPDRTPTYVIDFDSTLITSESLDDFGAMILSNHPKQRELCDELQAITELGMTGKLPFDASLAARLKLFQAHRSDVEAFSASLTDKLSPSATACSDWFRKNADNIIVISGGFEEFIIPVVAKLGIVATNVYANGFMYDEAGNITGHDTTRHTAKAGGKVAQIHALQLDGPVIAIGDGYTDLEMRMYGAADSFWAYTESVTRQDVVAKADRIMNCFGDVVRSSLGLQTSQREL